MIDTVSTAPEAGAVAEEELLTEHCCISVSRALMDAAHAAGINISAAARDGIKRAIEAAQRSPPDAGVVAE